MVEVPLEKLKEFMKTVGPIAEDGTVDVKLHISVEQLFAIDMGYDGVIELMGRKKLVKDIELKEAPPSPGSEQAITSCGKHPILSQDILAKEDERLKRHGHPLTINTKKYGIVKLRRTMEKYGAKDKLIPTRPSLFTVFFDLEKGTYTHDEIQAMAPTLDWDYLASALNLLEKYGIVTKFRNVKKMSYTFGEPHRCPLCNGIYCDFVIVSNRCMSCYNKTIAHPKRQEKAVNKTQAPPQ